MQATKPLNHYQTSNQEVKIILLNASTCGQQQRVLDLRANFIGADMLYISAKLDGTQPMAYFSIGF